MISSAFKLLSVTVKQENRSRGFWCSRKFRLSAPLPNTNRTQHTTVHPFFVRVCTNYLMKEVFFLSFITLFVLAHTAVPPLQEALAGANLPPCTSKAYYFDIVGSKDKAFLFVVEMVPATKANWTMYMTRDNPETAFGFTSTCAIDTAVLKASDFPNPLIIEKSCGEVEGRWYVVVESDSGTTARFAFKDVQSKGRQNRFLSNHSSFDNHA